MFNLSGSEIVVILLLALVVLGPEKLPDALRRAGRTYAELKKMGDSFQSEVKSALDEPMKEMRETADLLRKAADLSDDDAGVGAGSGGGSGNRATPAAVTTPRAVVPQPAVDAPLDIEVVPAEELDPDLVNATLSGGSPPPTVMPDTATASVTTSPGAAPPTSDEEATAPSDADEPSTT